MSSSPAPLRRARLSTPSPVLTRALALFIALHGIAHLAGTSDSFAKAADGRSVDYLAGAWSISDPTLLRLLGLLWALVGAAFIVSAVVVWAQRPGWPLVLGAVALASLLLVAVAVWSSTVGVVIDIALLLVAGLAGALRHPELRR